MAKLEVQRLIETVKKQQQQFADLPEQLNLDPNIPLTFTRVNCKIDIDKDYFILRMNTCRVMSVCKYIVSVCICVCVSVCVFTVIVSVCVYA